MLRCQRLAEQFPGIFNCRASKGGLKSGCRSCIPVPPMESLLELDLVQKQNELKDTLRQHLKAKKAMLVLGAGISIPAHMPDWGRLVSQMSGYAFQYQAYRGKGVTDDRRERLFHIQQDLIANKLTILNGVNVLEAAQYVQDTLDLATDAQFGHEMLKEIISAIIENSESPEVFLEHWVQKHPKQDPKSGDPATLRSIAACNTLSAVAYLLQAENGFRRAMTYNYDTLVQEYLISLFDVPQEKIVTHSERWTEPVTEDSIEIFHLHGCIPRKVNQGQYPAFPAESLGIILSEDSYYDTERYAAYNWQNSVQSFYLNRDYCVFLGFSADDYNFRRILRQLGDQMLKRPTHYLILTADQLIRDAYESICRSHLSGKMNATAFDRDTRVLLNQELRMKEKYWARYGFIPIWVTIQDIPNLLLSLV